MFFFQPPTVTFISSSILVPADDMVNLVDSELWLSVCHTGSQEVPIFFSIRISPSLSCCDFVSCRVIFKIVQCVNMQNGLEI